MKECDGLIAESRWASKVGCRYFFKGAGMLDVKATGLAVVQRMAWKERVVNECVGSRAMPGFT